MGGGGGRYDGEWHENKVHGQGTYTHSTGQGTYTHYTGAFDKERPTQGVLTEADGHRFTVTYDKTCASIYFNPTPQTKVGVLRGDAVLELQ